MPPARVSEPNEPKWKSLYRRLAVVALASAAVGCGNPLTIATWLELQPGSVVEAADTSVELEGGVFARIEIDLSDLLRPTGTIHVEQVRIAGNGGFFGRTCVFRDADNATPGSFQMDLLQGTQDVEFPLATVTTSGALEFIFGIAEIRSLTYAQGVEFPLDDLDLAPVLDAGRIDGLLTLPVVMDTDFELMPDAAVPAVLDLLLTSSSGPPVFSDPLLELYCQFRASGEGPDWARLGRVNTYWVNPKGAYLHHVNEDKVQEPLVIDLADVYASPGDTLRITGAGHWDGLFQADLRRLAAVFSETDELHPVDPPAILANDFWGWVNFRPHRVPGAIDAGLDTNTPLTFGHLNWTDIPEDFDVSGTVDVVVPPGARYLFVAPVDNVYSDNVSAALRVDVAVVK
ncbi:MAG: hypothetical protein ACQGVC_16230 [Myxococcota bacterium]